MKSNKDEHAEKLSQEAYRLYRTVQSIIHTKEPDLVQHLTPCYSTLFDKNSNSSVSVQELNLVIFFFFTFFRLYLVGRIILDFYSARFSYPRHRCSCRVPFYTLTEILFVDIIISRCYIRSFHVVNNNSSYGPDSSAVTILCQPSATV